MEILVLLHILIRFETELPIAGGTEDAPEEKEEERGRNHCHT